MPIARGVELGCWLAALMLVLGLILLPAPNAPAPAKAIAARTLAPAPHLSIYQQHCMERILSRSADKTEEYVVGLIDHLCFAPFRGRPSFGAGQAVPSCDRPFMVRLSPALSDVGGCLAG
jgi:hypothetical protein